MYVAVLIFAGCLTKLIVALIGRSWPEAVAWGFFTTAAALYALGTR